MGGNNPILFAPNQGQAARKKGQQKNGLEILTTRNNAPRSLDKYAIENSGY